MNNEFTYLRIKDFINDLNNLVVINYKTLIGDKKYT